MEKGSSSSSATVIRSVASGKQTENNRFKFRRGGDVFRWNTKESTFIVAICRKTFCGGLDLTMKVVDGWKHHVGWPEKGKREAAIRKEGRRRKNWEEKKEERA
ncbi:hypothetical protein MTR_3g082170 [Medicago truncatula]|uniref:Uncharacterized protein n=1 Tax=Medicago truncatula TaxID=3880 RepID=G7J836_MEDTR|nr:hypothetical protein MTR_3g082170 [Medicago truncatula]